VELTGDPRSAISALFKLSSLNMMPLHWTKWSEKWLTHPSSLRRAQAIARKAGIPIEQIPEIAGAAVAQSDHYILPATIAPGAKVLSTQTKQKTTIRATMAMLQALILIAESVCVASSLLRERPRYPPDFLPCGAHRSHRSLFRVREFCAALGPA
jgi:hypothetical protein